VHIYIFSVTIELMLINSLQANKSAFNGLRLKQFLQITRSVSAHYFTKPSAAQENMSLVSKAITSNSKTILKGLRAHGWAIVDNFLGLETCKTYRDEASTFFQRNEMTLSQSTRWDDKTQSIVKYDKHNVYAAQLMGGEMYYRSPRLHEYVVSLIKNFFPIVSNEFPEACLSNVMASNKLAVCTGDGSYYDKHYDNAGANDLRKLTVLYYMNPSWRADLGGCFRIYQRGCKNESVPVHGFKGVNVGDDTCIDIEPIGDRLLVFWSDQLVHSVQPSQAPFGLDDYRWALTVWLTATHPGAICSDDSEVQKHFTRAQKGVQG
jgi:hypothetical protein